MEPSPTRHWTAADRELAALVAAGVTSAAIASRLGVSVRTTDARIDDLRRRTGARTRTQLAGSAGAEAIGPVARVALCRDERALLDALLAGESLAGAAGAASMSLRTAWRRLASARRKFGVTTTAAAVAAYARMRLAFPPCPSR